MRRLKNFTSGLAFRIISGSVLFLLIFSWIVSIVGYIRFTDTLTREYTDSAFRTAETAVAVINADKIDEYLQNKGDSEDYRLSAKRLDILCQKQNVTLIYVIAVDKSDYGRFVSVFNAVNADSGYTAWEVGYERDTTNEEYQQVYKDIYENGLERGTVVRTSSLNGKEPHITSLVPVKGADGEVKAILCVQRPMSELKNGRRSYILWVAVATAIVSAFVAVSTGYYLKREFIIPVEKVIDEAQRFAQENSKENDLDLGSISSIREIKKLGASIEKMEQDTLEYIDNLTRITMEKERIGTELELATKIQADMLPNIFPAFPSRSEFDIFASMTPAKEVGGDFYDFFLIDEDHLALVIADVSGKGVPAALFMMMSKIFVNNYTMMGGSPSEILERVNKAICKNNENDMFVTVWLGILTISTGKIVAANAGHEYPILKKANGEFELIKDKHGFVIGSMEGVRYKDYEMTLDKGGTLFVYTDGAPEATNGNMEMFGTDRILQELNKQPEADAEQVIANTKKAVDLFVGEAPQFDDLTMLAIKLI